MTAPRLLALYLDNDHVCARLIHVSDEGGVQYCPALAAGLLHAGQLAHPMRPESATAAAACGPLTVVSLAALVLPYFLRMVQCISVWRGGGPASQLFNALKYASSLPALMLTQMEHEHHVHK